MKKNLNVTLQQGNAGTNVLSGDKTGYEGFTPIPAVIAVRSPALGVFLGGRRGNLPLVMIFLYGTSSCDDHLAAQLPRWLLLFS